MIGNALRQLFVSFTVNFDDKPLKKGQDQIKKTTDGLKKLAAVAGVALSVKGIQSYVNGHIQAADAIGKAAQKAGLTNKAFQELQFIADRTGTPLEGLRDNVFELTKRLGEMRERGSGPAVDALRILGLSIKDFAGISQLQSFEIIRGELSKITDQQKQAILSDQLFGGQAKQTLNVLRLSADAYRKLRLRFDELGGGYSDEFIENSAEFNDQMADARLLLTGVGGGILKALMPHLMALGKWWSGPGLQGLKTFTDNTENLKRVFKIVGAAATAYGIKMALANLPIVAAAAAVGALIFALEDLMAYFDGGESVGGGIALEIMNWIDQVLISVDKFFARMGFGLAKLVENIPGVGGAWAKALREQANADLASAEQRKQSSVFGYSPAGPGLGGALAAPASNTKQDFVFYIDGSRNPAGTANHVERAFRNTQAANQ